MHVLGTLLKSLMNSEGVRHVNNATLCEDIGVNNDWMLKAWNGWLRAWKKEAHMKSQEFFSEGENGVPVTAHTPRQPITAGCWTYWENQILTNDARECIIRCKRTTGSKANKNYIVRTLLKVEMARLKDMLQKVLQINHQPSTAVIQDDNSILFYAGVQGLGSEQSNESDDAMAAMEAMAMLTILRATTCPDISTNLKPGMSLTWGWSAHKMQENDDGTHDPTRAGAHSRTDFHLLELSTENEDSLHTNNDINSNIEAKTVATLYHTTNWEMNTYDKADSSQETPVTRLLLTVSPGYQVPTHKTKRLQT